MNHEQLLDLITAREAAATTQAEHLRQQIATLTDQLTVIDTELADLTTTRTTLLRLAGTTDHTPTPTHPTTTNPAYQQIIAVLTTTGDPLRAKDICRALNAGTTTKDTERLRAKLKRLVARGVLTEPEPGQFTLAQPATRRANPTPTP